MGLATPGHGSRGSLQRSSQNLCGGSGARGGVLGLVWAKGGQWGVRVSKSAPWVEIFVHGVGGGQAPRLKKNFTFGENFFLPPPPPGWNVPPGWWS